jgi:D-tyrosyl-tRNA(Tyr) deacylase
MKALLQRVGRAAVRVEGRTVASIGTGLLVLVGVETGDAEADADRLADKTAGLRIFSDDAGRMNRSVVEIGGEVLVVSQFTLAASTERGRRPSFTRAAEPTTAARLWIRYADRLAACGLPVARGVFGAMMEVELVNDGPVTIWLDSTSVRGAS